MVLCGRLQGLQGSRTQRAVLGILALIGVVYLGFEVDSGWRALHQTTYYMTARPASKEIAVFAAATLVVGVVALMSPLRLRMLAVLGPLLVFAVVILATAIIGGRALAMADALLIMLALWFTGDRFLRALGLSQLADRRIVAWVAGLGPLVLLSTVLGRVSAFRWWDIGLLVVVLGLAGAVSAARILVTQRASVVAAVTEDAVSAASAGALLLTMAVMAVYTAAPEIQYDPLYGKAYLPMLWARTGRIVGIPQHIQLAVGGWFQIVGAWGNLLGAASTGRYLQLLAIIALPAVIWSFARSRGLLAPLAAVAVGIIPMLFWQATTSDDDGLIAVGALGVMLAVFASLQPGFRGSDRVTALALGLLVGTAWSMKTHVIPLSTVLLLGWVMSRHGLRAKTVRAAGGLLGLLITAAPPLILRWVDLGNPVLPAYNNIFKSPDWLPVNATLNFPFWPNAGLSGFLRSPFEAVFQPGLMNESASPGAFGAFAGLVLVAALIGWCARKRVPGSLVLWIALVIAIVVWWKEFRYLRYFLPEGLLATVLLLSVAPRVSIPRRVPGRAAIVVCIVLGSVAYLSVSVADLWNVPNKKVPIKAALGIWHANDYLTTAAGERPDILAFDRLSSSDAVMLTNAYERTWLTGRRDLYVPFEATDLAEAHHTPTDSVSDSLRALARLKITWVLTDPSNGNIGAESPNKRGIESNWLAPVLSQHGSVRYAADSYTLFQLSTKPRPEHPAAVCDRTGKNLPSSCWQGTRNSAGQVDDNASRSLSVCPGEILDLKVTQAAGHAAEGVDITLPQQPPDEQSSAGLTTPGGTADVYQTVLRGSTQAVFDVVDPAAAGISAAKVEVIGSCRPSS